MNATNVKNSITTMINNAVTAGDLSAAPLQLTNVVAQIASILQTEEAHALQKAKDITTHNVIAKSLNRPL